MQIDVFKHLLDPEHPSPSSVVRNDAAQNKSQHAWNSYDGACQARNPLRHLRGANLWENDHSERVKARPAHTLKRPACNKLIQGLWEATSDGEGKKDHESGCEGIAAPDDVSDTCKGDCAAKIGERVGKGNPGDGVCGSELYADGVEGGCDDGGVKEGEEETEAETGDTLVPFVADGNKWSGFLGPDLMLRITRRQVGKLGPSMWSDEWPPLDPFSILFASSFCETSLAEDILPSISGSS
jgi:hypothetical protein